MSRDNADAVLWNSRNSSLGSEFVVVDDDDP